MNRIQALDAYADKIADINDATQPEFWLDICYPEARSTGHISVRLAIRPISNPAYPALDIEIRVRDTVVRPGSRDPSDDRSNWVPTVVTTRENVLEHINAYHALHIHYHAERARRKDIEENLIATLNAGLEDFMPGWGLALEVNGATVHLVANPNSDTAIPLTSTSLVSLINNAVRGETIDPLSWMCEARNFSTTPRLTSARTSARQLLTLIAAAPALFFPDLPWTPR